MSAIQEHEKKLNIYQKLYSLIDSYKYKPNSSLRGNKIDYYRISPFIILHMGCLLVFYVKISQIAIFTALFLYFIRLFAITAFYHRYFSHRAFKTSRTWQFVFAVLGASSAQRGPLWWAAHHRNHHRHSDRFEDHHSPRQHGFWTSHIKWFLLTKNFETNTKLIPDLIKFPELVFLDRFDIIVPIILGLLIFFSGFILNYFYPSLQTNGLQLLVWGFFISTVAVMHTTFSINSIAHRYGKRRYNIKDDSRNNFLLAIFSLGEGWHNNHHYFPSSACQGFFWWEIDVTYYILRLMSFMGIINNMRLVPKEIRENFDRNQKEP